MADKRAPEIEQRFTELRPLKLSGRLAKAERAELNQIQAVVETVEIKILAPSLSKLEAKQDILNTTLEEIKTENNELVQLLNQQAMLIADTKYWLGGYYF